MSNINMLFTSEANLINVAFDKMQKMNQARGDGENKVTGNDVAGALLQEHASNWKFGNFLYNFIQEKSEFQSRVHKAVGQAFIAQKKFDEFTSNNSKIRGKYKDVAEKFLYQDERINIKQNDLYQHNGRKFCKVEENSASQTLAKRIPAAEMAQAYSHTPVSYKGPCKGEEARKIKAAMKAELQDEEIMKEIMNHVGWYYNLRVELNLSDEQILQLYKNSETYVADKEPTFRNQSVKKKVERILKQEVPFEKVDEALQFFKKSFGVYMENEQQDQQISNYLENPGSIRDKGAIEKAKEAISEIVGICNKKNNEMPHIRYFALLPKGLQSILWQDNKFKEYAQTEKLAVNFKPKLFEKSDETMEAIVLIALLRESIRQEDFLANKIMDGQEMIRLFRIGERLVSRIYPDWNQFSLEEQVSRVTHYKPLYTLKYEEERGRFFHVPDACCGRCKPEETPPSSPTKNISIDYIIPPPSLKIEDVLEE